MYEETRRKALKKSITDAHTTREALEIARARLFELLEEVEAEARDADDIDVYSSLMAESDGVERAWERIDELISDLREDGA